MAKSESKPNRYQQSVKERGYENLPIPDHTETMMELCIEGMKLLKEEEKKSAPKVDETKRLQDSLAASASGPYAKARLKILNDLPPERRIQIEEMEKKGKINNPLYEKFVKMIATLGDKLSEKSTWQSTEPC